MAYIILPFFTFAIKYNKTPHVKGDKSIILDISPPMHYMN